MKPIAVLSKGHDTFLDCYLSFKLTETEGIVEFANFREGFQKVDSVESLNKFGSLLITRICSLPSVTNVYSEEYKLNIYFEEKGDLENMVPFIIEAIKLATPIEIKEDGEVFYCEIIKISCE